MSSPLVSPSLSSISLYDHLAERSSLKHLTAAWEGTLASVRVCVCIICNRGLLSSSLTLTSFPAWSTECVCMHLLTPPRPSSCHTLLHIWPSAQIRVWLWVCLGGFGCLVDPSSPLSCQSSITQGLSSCPASDKHQTPFHTTLCFFGLHSISLGRPSGLIHDTVPCCENACSPEDWLSVLQ